MYKISTQPFDFLTIYNLILNQTTVEISEDAILKIKECRAFLERKIADSKAPIYGINTGFGALCNVKVSNENLKKLQANLVRSHACGTGA
ncbi:MAG: aromatic amino acid lyase, partial [Bacteroidota bacterium]|nr:aromatic amino acid lyase [Bacteroidota bacterium]